MPDVSHAIQQLRAATTPSETSAVATSTLSEASSARTQPISPTEAERLRALAAQFESILIGQMLREMRSSTFEDDDESGFGGGALADSLYAELSLALSRAGGFGLAEAMRAPLTRQAGEPGAKDASQVIDSNGLNAGVPNVAR